MSKPVVNCENINNTNIVTLRFLGSKKYTTQSIFVKNGFDLLCSRYNNIFLFSFLIEQPKYVCILGLGGGCFNSFIYRHFHAHVTNVEIDSVVVNYAKKYFQLPKENSKFKTVIQDGKKFIEEYKKYFNIIVVDVFDNGTKGNLKNFHTYKFYRDVFRRLTAHGILMVNLISTDDEIPIKYIKAHFKHVLIIKLETLNTVVFAFKYNYEKLSISQLKDKAKTLNLTTINFERIFEVILSQVKSDSEYIYLN